MVEDAGIRTLYDCAERTLPRQRRQQRDAFQRWPECRVLEVSPLLRELVAHLDTAPGSGGADEREACLAALILDELRRGAGAPGHRAARRQAPAPDLRRRCWRHRRAGARWAVVAREVGASPRTLARLFRSELGTSFVQWRQQVLLSHAVTLAARKAADGHHRRRARLRQRERLHAAMVWRTLRTADAVLRLNPGVPPARGPGRGGRHTFCNTSSICRENRQLPCTCG